jgi:hypothetical protein
MKKWIFSISLLLSSTFTFGSIDSSQAVSPRFFQAYESSYVSPGNISNEYLIVRPMSVVGFDNESMVKMNKAFEVLEKVVNSEEFKNRVINFKNTQNERSFASNNGLSNEQIFDSFMEGRETLQPNTPGEMNFFLKLYHKRYSKVIGWTDGSINVININWKFFKNFKPNEVAGNLAHEWTHKLGFDHQSAAEHDSAPYAIGYIVREMGERYLQGKELY